MHPAGGVPEVVTGDLRPAMGEDNHDSALDGEQRPRGMFEEGAGDRQSHGYWSAFGWGG